VITVTDVRVGSFTLEYLDVTWAIVPTTEDLQEYTFTLERAEADFGPWTAITPALIDRYYVRDNEVHLHSTTRQYFYRVRVTHTPTGETTTTAPVTVEGALPLDAAEIVRLEAVQFQEVIGTRFWLFPVRTFGQRCPQCWDKLLARKTDDRCPVCWGTTFSGGYHYPVAFWGQMDPTEQSDQVTSTTHLQTERTRMRCGPSPYLKSGDLVVDYQNHRFRVTQVSATRRLGRAVHQEAAMVRISKGSIEDRVPLQVDANTVTVAPPRVFTNPQTLEAATTLTLESLYGLYRPLG
jgi:hypothetical protein